MSTYFQFEHRKWVPKKSDFKQKVDILEDIPPVFLPVGFAGGSQ